MPVVCRSNLNELGLSERCYEALFATRGPELVLKNQTTILMFKNKLSFPKTINLKLQYQINYRTPRSLRQRARISIRLWESAYLNFWYDILRAAEFGTDDYIMASCCAPRLKGSKGGPCHARGIQAEEPYTCICTRSKLGRRKKQELSCGR